MKHLFLLLLIISHNVSGQTAAPNKSDSTIMADTLNWPYYENNNFSILYPDDWLIDTSKSMGVDLFLFSALESKDDNFRENVNVLMADFGSEKISLDSFVHVSERQIKTMANNYKIVESKYYNGPAIQYHKIEFTATQGIFDLHFIQYYFVSGQKGVTITLTTTQKSFNHYKETGLKILNSFRLKN